MAKKGNKNNNSKPEMRRRTKAGKYSGNVRQPKPKPAPSAYMVFSTALKGAREVVFPDGVRVLADAITRREASLLMEAAAKGRLYREGDRVVVK